MKASELEKIRDALTEAIEYGVDDVHIVFNTQGCWCKIETIEYSKITGVLIYVKDWEKDCIGYKQKQ